MGPIIQNHFASAFLRLPAIAFVLLIQHGLRSQNLVLNGSFEDTLCIGAVGTLPVPYAGEHWYNPNYGTSDLYAMEPPIPGCGVGWMNDPAWTALGVWQAPFEGDGLAGLYCYHSFFCLREYLQVPLSEALDHGKEYCVSFRVALRGNSTYALDRLGMHFSIDPVLDWGGNCILGVEAQVQSPENEWLMAPGEWMMVEGEYLSQGGESYITIGNFVPDSDVNAQMVDSTSSTGSAYYYIDEVVVELCEISTGADDREGSGSSWYDASNALLHVPGEAGVAMLRVMDMHGRLVREFPITGPATVISLETLPAGQYLAVIDRPARREVLRIGMVR